MSTSSLVSRFADSSRGLGAKRSYRTQVRLHRSICSSWATLDLSLLCATMLWMVFAAPVRRHELALSTVLAMRVSIVNILLALACVLLWRLSMQATRLELGGSPVSLSALFLQIAMRVTACTGIAGLVLWVRHPGRLTFAGVLTFWCLAFLLFATGRAVWVTLAVSVAPLLRRGRSVIIVGSGWRAHRLGEEIGAHPRWRYKVLGFVDSEAQFEGVKLLGHTDELESILMQQVVDEVIIALPMKSMYEEIQTAIAACERVGIQSGYSTDLFTTEITKRRSVDEHDTSSVALHMVHNDNRRHFKRALDLFGATLGLIFLSPLLLLIAGAVKFTSRGPVIFRQRRLGLNKRTFYMYKFRSMVDDAELQQENLEHLNETGGPVFKIRGDPRVTPIGRLIRKASIDELPQLFNILRGEMSLVGPRPLPIRDVSRFSEAWLMRRFSVPPGLTGLWQVSGRSDTGFTNWIELDLKYIDTWSLSLDLQILAKTFPAVLKGRGAA